MLSNGSRAMSIDNAAYRGEIMRRSLRAVMSEEDGIAVDVWFNPDFDRVSVKPIHLTPPALRTESPGDPTRRTVVLTWRDGAVEIKVSLSYGRDDEADLQLLQIANDLQVSVVSRRQTDVYGDIWAVFSIPLQTEWMRDALPIVIAFCGFAVRENIFRHRLSSMFPHASVRSSSRPDAFFLCSDGDEERHICFQLRNRDGGVNRLLILPSPECGFRAESSVGAAARVAFEMYHSDFGMDADGVSAVFERLEDIAPVLAAVNAIARPMLQID